MIISCVTCKNDMNTSSLELKERQLGRMIKVFFECPSCKNEYFVMYHNEETKSIQKRIEIAKRNGDLETFNELQPIFKKKLDKLNNR